MEEEQKETTTNTAETKSDTKKLLMIAVPLVIVVIIIAGIVFTRKSAVEEVQEAKTGTTEGNSNVQTTATPANVNYKDGSYTAEGDYVTHVGQKHISVKITLKKNIITEASVTNEADDAMSVKYQDKFISGYKALVIGKDINGVHLSAVSGSSLTPNGFNAALATIEAQAKM